MLLSLTGPALRADPLAEALPILQAKYPDFRALHYKPGDKLEDLIARSNGKINLSAPETASAPIPIVTAILSGDIIYWRLASFTLKKDWTDLAAELKMMVDVRHTAGAVLDLRGNTTPDDYAGAAHVAVFFASADLSLKYLPQKEDVSGLPPLPIPGRKFNGPLIVLTNGQTSGAAEALAACLKADGALVIGRATGGTTSVFEDDKLSSGQVLRFAVAQPTLPKDTPLFGRPVIPVIPDIAVTVDDRTEQAALALIGDNHILDVIEESPERHRLSEAALVQGQDPEWDNYLASLERKPVLLSLPVIHDAALISALDSLKAIRLSERSIPPQSQADASPQSSASLQ